mgnify:FL=1|jgi:hypothetical protein
MSTLKVNAITETDGSDFPYGKILQAKCTPSNNLAQASKTGNDYDDVTGIDLVITPKSASSTMILVTSFHGSTSGGSINLSVRLTFNHSGISQTVVDSNQDGYSQSTSSGSNDQFGSMIYTHTPNTTNEITYRFQYRNASGSGTVYFNKKVSKIIAYEVAA